MRQPDRSARPTPGRVRRLIPLAAALFLSACATTGEAPAPFAHIVIVNDSSSIVTVYALPGGSRVRIGQVRGINQQEFALRRRHLDGSNQLRLLIDPLGSPRHYPTDSIVVVEGDVIEFRVSSFVR